MKSSTLNLIYYLLKKDIAGKYTASGLGLLWAIITPISQILIYWLVFSQMMKTKPYLNTQLPYAFFLLSSFFFWLAFLEGVINSTNSITNNAEMVKKVVFPHYVLPVTSTITSYIHNIIGFGLFMLFYFFQMPFSLIIITVVPVIILQLLFSIGIGIFMASLLPYLRDIGHIIGHVMQGLFFLSPVIYSIDTFPEKIQMIFYINPMTYFIDSYHRILLMQQIPSVSCFFIMLTYSLLSCTIGFLTFKKLHHGFADVL